MCKSALSILNAIDTLLATMLALAVSVSLWHGPVHHNTKPCATNQTVTTQCSAPISYSLSPSFGVCSAAFTPML